MLQFKLGQLDGFLFIRNLYFLDDSWLHITEPVGANLEVIYGALAQLNTLVWKRQSGYTAPDLGSFRRP
jgi:hypothetical protein